jgi:hypothetical protein
LNGLNLNLNPLEFFMKRRLFAASTAVAALALTSLSAFAQTKWD